MLSEMYKLAFGISVTLLTLAFFAMPVVEKNSAQYYVLIISIILNAVFSIILILIFYVRKKRS